MDPLITLKLRPYLFGAAAVTAAAIAAAAGHEKALGLTGGPLAMGIRVVWAASLALFGLLRQKRSETADVLQKPFVVWNVAACSLLAHLAGRMDSPAYYALIALPLLQSPFIRGRVSTAIVSGVATFVGAMSVAWMHAPQSLALTAFIFAAVGGAMVQAAWMYRSYARAVLESEKRRRQASELEWNLALRQANSERLAVMGRIAAAVAHEVNNPLAYVRANLNFLRTELAANVASPEVRSELSCVLDETVEGLDRIQQISSDLRGVAREPSEPPRSIDLSTVLSQALRMARLRTGPRVRINVTGTENLPTVFVSPSRLSQVLLNLLANAGDALATHPSPEICVSASFLGDSVSVSIEDNGPGLPPEWKSRLFKPFFTTKAEGEGTGLGLTLSRHYVESFGGALSAENREGGGARFTLTMPITAMAPLDPRLRATPLPLAEDEAPEMAAPHKAGPSLRFG